MCIQDNDDCFVLAKTTLVSLLCLVKAGEALGLYTVLTWMVDLQLDDMDFVLNSKNVVDYFNTYSSDIIKFDSIMLFCITLISNLAGIKPMWSLTH